MFGSVYAFTSDGLSMRQLRDYVEQVRAQIRDVPGLGKIQMIGEQDEVLYLNFSTRKLAALGIDQRQVVQSLQSQNAVDPGRGYRGRTGGGFRYGLPGNTPRRKTWRRSTSSSMTASTGWPILPRSAAAMSIRRLRCSATTASRPSAWRSP